MAGIGEDVADSDGRGSIYMRNPNTQLLNGILLENAGNRVRWRENDVIVNFFRFFTRPSM